MTENVTIEIPSMFVPYIMDAVKAAFKDSFDKKNAAHFSMDWEGKEYYQAQTTYYCDAYNALVDALEKR